MNTVIDFDDCSIHDTSDHDDNSTNYKDENIVNAITQRNSTFKEEKKITIAMRSLQLQQKQQRLHHRELYQRHLQQEQHQEHQQDQQQDRIYEMQSLQRSITPEVIEDAFDLQILDFESPGIVQQFAGSVRFGLPSDFANFFGTSQQKQEYIRGLLGLGCITASLYFVWIILLLRWYWIGKQQANSDQQRRRRCGGAYYFSGKPFQKTQYCIKTKNNENSENNNNIYDYENDVNINDNENVVNESNGTKDTYDNEENNNIDSNESGIHRIDESIMDDDNISGNANNDNSKCSVQIDGLENCHNPVEHVEGVVSPTSILQKQDNLVSPLLEQVNHVEELPSSHPTLPSSGSISAASNLPQEVCGDIDAAGTCRNDLCAVFKVMSDDDKFKNDTCSSSNPSQNDGTGYRTICGVDEIIFIRCTFTVSGCIVILFSILLVTQGLTRMQSSVNTINTASTMILDVTDAAQDELRLIIPTLQTSFNEINKHIQSELQSENICPASSAVNATLPIVQTLQLLAVEALQALERIDVITNSTFVTTISDSVSDIQRSAQSYYDTTSRLNFTDWKAVLFILVYTIPTATILTSTVLILLYGKTNQKLHYWIEKFIFPLFMGLMIVAVIVSSGSVIVASSNSDFCYPKLYKQTSGDPESIQIALLGQSTMNTAASTGSANSTTGSTSTSASTHFNAPDVTSLQVLEMEGFVPGSLDYMIALFYITQCTRDPNPVDPITSMLQDLEIVQGIFLKLSSTDYDMSNITSPLVDACGRTFVELDAAIIEAKSLGVSLLESFYGLLTVVRCDNITPIYQTIFYEATCDYSVKGLFWIFSASLIVSFFGFLMITFRSAYTETEYTFWYKPPM